MNTPRTPAVVEILRPVNCVLTFLSVLLGGWLAAADVPMALMVAGLSAAAIAGAGNALNDIVDVQRDRVNRPDRPLPSDRLSGRTALFLAAALSTLGLALAARLPLSAVLLAAAAVVGLVAYNLWLKDIPIAGNLVVACLGATAFLYGAAAVGPLGPAGIAAGFAGVYHFGREVLKDLADQAGDRLAAGDSLPLRWGQRPALAAACAAFAVVILASPLPFLMDIYGVAYLALVALMDALLLHLLWQVWKSPDTARFARVARLLKVGMPLGLAAILLGSL